MSDPFATVELAPENMSKRLPAILLLDTSYSMDGEPIKALNEGLRVLEEEFDPATGDSLALRSVEFALVTFGSNGVQLVDLMTGQGGTNVNEAFVEAIDYRAPVLSAGGGTPMGEAMELALRVLDERKQYYRQHNIPYFRPWIFLISDGEPTDQYETAIAAAKQAQADKKALIFSIGVQDANMKILQEFSQLPAIPLDGLKFRELFKFISSSVSQASTSDPDATTVALDIVEMKSFTQIPLD